jgi:outer membrane protein assembly factor BamB
LSYAPRHGNGGSPVLIDGLLVFSCDAESDPFVVALDRETRDVRWRTPRNSTAFKKFSFSTPTIIEVDGKPQIVSCGSGFVGAYAPEDGRELWRVNYGEGYSVVPRPVFANGLLFAISGYDDPQLLVIDPKDASGDATASNVVWKREKGVSLTPSPLVVGDELYLVSDNGIASCLDSRSGEEHWTKRLGGDFSASPVFAEGRVYFLNEAGEMYVVKASQEFELLARNDLAERAFASPAVTDNTIFLRSESHLWRIGE